MDASDLKENLSSGLDEASNATMDRHSITTSVAAEKEPAYATVSEDTGVYVTEMKSSISYEDVLNKVESYARISNAASLGSGAEVPSDEMDTGTRFKWLPRWMRRVPKAHNVQLDLESPRNTIDEEGGGKQRGKVIYLKSLSRPIDIDEDNQTYAMMENGSIADSDDDGEDVDRKEMLDRMFVRLFLFHLGVVLLYPFVMGTAAGYGTVAYLIVKCSMFAAAVSVGIFFIMLKFPGKWLRSSMIISLNVLFGVLVVAFLREDSAPCLTLLVLFVLSFMYCKYSWKRLPFAASSFYTAVSVIKSNFALYKVAFIIQLAAVAWCIVWTVACTWAISAAGIWVGLVFLASYFWNIMHVSAAMLVGEWWLSPGEGNPYGSKRTLRESFTSFGSICFGSLFVNCFLGLRKLVMHNYKNQGGDSRLLLFVHDASVYTNKWGFVYVGLYEYSFFRAGREVAILFQDKGWHQLIADDLTDNILLIINLAVATSTGAFSWLLAANNTDYYMLRNLSYYHPYTTGFFVGFFAGFLVSSVLIAVFGGVANAIIVCFAERPHILENMHPSQFAMLLDGWSLELPEGIKKPKSRGRNIYEEGTKKKKKKKKKETKKSIWSKEEPILEDLIVDNLQKGLDIIETAIR
ncbi:hypothetical protein ACHAW5_000985 [Stephanodiscus triporus]|uniref:Choline transporter-like protein n=1 Tax=Stephanodiscus triporus TaxID=2934178 RepID=A0ABD3NAI1_9STRA